jgi:hypothetical protein
MSETLKNTNVHKNCLGGKGLNCWLWGAQTLSCWRNQFIRRGRKPAATVVQRPGMDLAWRSGAQTQQQEIDGAAFAYKRSDGMSVPAGRSFSSPSSRMDEHVLLVAEGQSLAHLGVPVPSANQGHKFQSSLAVSY